MSKLYDEDSIKSLSPLAFTRLRPGVYCGSTEYSTQLLIEIVSNAIDEHKAGHGNNIYVSIDENNIYTVEDEGQGFIPNSIREDGKTVLEAAFSILNTSGKYDENGVYEGTALGLNGIGSKLATYLSHWLEVTTWRDGQCEHVTFKEGVFDKRDSINPSKSPSGTIVKWQPSEEFFTHTEVDLNVIKHLFEVLVCLCPGLTIYLKDKDGTTIFNSKNGLNDLLDDKVKDSEIINNRLNMSFADGKNKLDMVMTYTTNYSSTIVPYVNTGLTDSGPHITQIKTIITREMNKFFRERGWLKEKEENLSGDDCQEGLYIVFNITAPGVSYDAQTKSRVVKLDMKPFTQALTEELQNWLTANEKDAKLIAEKAILAKKARESARKAREATRNVAGKKINSLKSKMEISDKFTDCTNKNPKDRSLLVVEGISAGAAAVEARNPKRDAIYTLRGKILSCLKTTEEKVLSNQVLSDLIKVIGAGFGKSFDISKMQFDKIVITSDQDSDGENIELLLIVFFYTYMRPLVEAGKLYRAITPLYIVTKGKEELHFYSEDEYGKWKAKNPGNYPVLRAKGLGELNAVDLKRVCFEDERYKRITISDAEATTKLLDTLMGSAVEPRKEYIYENATRLGFNFD